MANNKTPIMFFNLVLIFSFLVVTMVDSRTISDVPKMKTTESSPTFDAESTTTIGVESTSTTDSKATSTIDDVPDTIESISIGAESTPMIESAPLISTFGGQSPLRIGHQVFIGRKVDNTDDMTREFVKTIYAKYNCSALFVGEVMTIADTPHNRRIFSKGNVLPMAPPHKDFPTSGGAKNC